MTPSETLTYFENRTCGESGTCERRNANQCSACHINMLSNYIDKIVQGWDPVKAYEDAYTWYMASCEQIKDDYDTRNRLQLTGYEKMIERMVG